jgi:GT2 family glycosyltransferase
MERGNMIRINIEHYKSTASKILNVILITLNYPILFRKFFYNLKREGLKATIKKTFDYINRYPGYSPRENKLYLIKETNYELISFKQKDNPKVSIIIPVHNKFDYTYKCLKSIYDNTNLEEIEIIVADDGSTDETLNIGNYIKNIKVVRNDTPLGFLKNCNKAAKFAKGDYILFLNNDTQVQPNWLSSLLEVFHQDNKIGLVGSKFVYPDGRLQEAGGIVWKDASAWNYGRLDDPEKPEYNYLKEVDYISGACIIIKKDLWQDIGGFDERYTPAYYEDTDLAFEVRKRGFKVVYQPKSVVVHFEGITHGKETSSGIKKYQDINRNKFFEKWKDILEKEHFNNAEHVFLARDRSKDKKHVLFIDHYVPHYDQDAGSRAVFMWLKVIKELGLHITFVGDNFYRHEPYTSVLQNMGIEVLYGNYYLKNINRYIEENLKYFDFVILNRSWISDKYIDHIKNIIKKQNLNTSIIYIPHDLSYLRLEREYEVTKNKSLLEEAKFMKKLEFKLFNSSDKILVVSDFEREIIKKDFPNKEVYLVPLYTYEEDFPLSKNDDFNNRKDIMFVGGFRHRPNYYAVKWFVEKIFPKLKLKVPDIVFNIVGSAVPEDIKDLEKIDNNIKVWGYVSDEKLKELYDKVRLIVAPLNFGAGVKGKVIEAIAYGVPVVTTPIGSEGIPDADDIILVAKDEDEFVEKLLNVYTNEDLFRYYREKCISYARKYLSYDYCKSVYKDILKV